MDQFVIKGSQKLSGRVQISQAKNAYLPVLAACLMTDEPIKLGGVPTLRDINTMKMLLGNLGTRMDEMEEKSILHTPKLTSHQATYELVKTMRASICVLGPILAREGVAEVSLPGGCAIGTRPIDIHLKCLEALGAKIEIESGYVRASAEKLKGAKIALPFPSVGATENVMMAACLATGTTILENCAREPEVEDLGDFLMSMGAQIQGHGTDRIEIQGVERLHGCEYTPIADRIEAATFIISGLITGSEIVVENMNPSHLSFVLEKLKEMGARMEEGDRFVKVLPSELKAIEIDTRPFPGFPTDVQAQMMALMTQAEGTSVMTENIFENRFMHVPELQRLGAKIRLKGKTAVVEGKTSLSGAPVMCTDLRASAALVLAGLVSSGETHVRRVYHIDRGYESMEVKLGGLGADIKRVRD